MEVTRDSLREVLKKGYTISLLVEKRETEGQEEGTTNLITFVNRMDTTEFTESFLLFFCLVLCAKPVKIINLEDPIEEAHQVIEIISPRLICQVRATLNIAFITIVYESGMMPLVGLLKAYNIFIAVTNNMLLLSDSYGEDIAREVFAYL